QPGIGDRLLHGDVVPGCALAHEAGGATVEHSEGIELGLAMHTATEIQVSIVLHEDNAWLGFAKADQHFIEIVADRGYDPHARDDDAPHAHVLLAADAQSADPSNVSKQADPQVLGFVDDLAIGLDPAVGNAKRQSPTHHAL